MLLGMCPGADSSVRTAVATANPHASLWHDELCLRAKELVELDPERLVARLEHEILVGAWFGNRLDSDVAADRAMTWVARHRYVGKTQRATAKRGTHR